MELPKKNSYSSLWKIVSLISLIGCIGLMQFCTRSSSSDERILHEDEARQISLTTIDSDDLQEIIRPSEKAYLFFFCDWCEGSKLALNNTILPNLHHLKKKGIPVYISYMGESSKMGFNPDSLRELSQLNIYHLNDPLLNNAFFHKVTAADLLEDLDPEFQCPFQMPLSVIYENGSIREVNLAEDKHLIESRLGLAGN